jgi:hypothetical protein
MNDIQSEKYKPDYEALLQSLIDVIEEEQIKIGYRKEVIRLFYPAKSVNNLLGIHVTTHELLEILKDFVTFSKTKIGEITYSVNSDRFCFMIPENGVEYIHKNIDEYSFLKEFIQVISGFHCELCDIEQVFQKYSDSYHCEATNNDEFDYLLWFEGGKPDEYIYCIKFEEGHAIYHRFTKKDYEDFDF